MSSLQRSYEVDAKVEDSLAGMVSCLLPPAYLPTVFRGERVFVADSWHGRLVREGPLLLFQIITRKMRVPRRWFQRSIRSSNDEKPCPGERRLESQMC